MAETISRQARRLNRLAKEGITQTNVLVHEECRDSLDSLRPHLSNSDSAPFLRQIVSELAKSTPTNVAKVRQLSPFRYPGGKTWLVPTAREWVKSLGAKPKVFLEPFAGGGMISVSLAAEGLVESVKMVELDSEVSAVWDCIFNGSDNDFLQLTTSIQDFRITENAVRNIISEKPRLLHKKAFRTIVKNRCQRGGILAPGAGLIKNGESGRGLSSRWYPETLVKRMYALREMRSVIEFTQGDGMEAIQKNHGSVMFIDPPYTAGGKNAGRRLYTHNQIDHTELFNLVSNHASSALLTYDDSAEVRKLSSEHGFLLDNISMKTGHHRVMKELVIVK